MESAPKSVDNIKGQLTPTLALAMGWSLIPLHPDKRPAWDLLPRDENGKPTWKPFQQRQPTTEELSNWQEHKPDGWRMVCGRISNRITLDFDGEQGVNLARKFGIGLGERIIPHRRTPSGGFHVDFEYPGWPVKTLNSKAHKELGHRYPGLDIRADGGYAGILGRMRHGEYQWLRDSAPYSLELLPPALRDFLGLRCPPPEKEAGTARRLGGGGRIDSGRLVAQALTRASSTGRNNAGFDLACQLRDNGYTRDEAVQAGRNYVEQVPPTNTKGETEPYTIEEFLASVGQAYRQPAREPWPHRAGCRVDPVPSAGQAQDQPGGERTALPACMPGPPTDGPLQNGKSATGYFERNTDLRPEIIEGLIREGQIAVLGGPYGVGKTPLLADLTVHLLYGLAYCGRTVQKRPVICIDFESSAPSYKAAVRNIATRLGVLAPRVPDELDVYLEHDDPAEGGTAKLLAALKSGRPARLKLLHEALRCKPNAFVIVDPLEMLFRIDTLKKAQILELYSELRQLLSTYPHAALFGVFTLRKKDRKAKCQPDLLGNPRAWLEEICGSLDIVNRCDVRLGMDFHGAENRILNGVRRGEDMQPLLVRPVGSPPDRLAGFELVPPTDAELQSAFTARQMEHWNKLPSSFSFEEVADRTVPRASLCRLIDRAKSLGLLARDDATGRYRKVETTHQDP